MKKLLLAIILALDLCGACIATAETTKSTTQLDLTEKSQTKPVAMPLTKLLTLSRS